MRLVILVLVGVALGLPAAAAEGESGTYPIWWSPSLDLDSLDQLEARLHQSLWPSLPDNRSFTVLVTDNGRQREMRVRTCADTRAFSELTDFFWDSHGIEFLIQDVGWWRRPACMTKPLSNDLRERLVSAVDSGLSRRSAARRFGVAASTAIKWVNRWRRTGDVGPRPQGGDHRSHRIEAHAEEILALVDETPDITLGEIAAHLDAGHGLTVAQSTVWRLLDRHGMTFKKNRARLRATAS